MAEEHLKTWARHAFSIRLAKGWPLLIHESYDKRKIDDIRGLRIGIEKLNSDAWQIKNVN